MTEEAETDLNDVKRLTGVGRNAKCPCNSGKKFKNCCGGMVRKMERQYRRDEADKEASQAARAKLFKGIAGNK